MHIEPGVVHGAKMTLSFATAAGGLTLAGKLAYQNIKDNGGAVALVGRTVMTTALVVVFFQVLPHYPVGISEVHFIFGSTLFLMFGGGAAAMGLALGLLLQGLLFAPFDLPQYGVNVTTLLVPLWAVHALARRIISPNTPYVELRYSQALALSTVYQGGVVLWVAFWAFYGQGFGAENITAVSAFGAAYMLVVIVEPLADLAVLAGAKALRGLTSNALFSSRLHNAA